MSLTALETNLLKALKDALPAIDNAYKAGDLSALGVATFARSVIEAAEHKAKRKPPRVLTPGPRCKRTRDMFEGGGK